MTTRQNNNVHQQPVVSSSDIAILKMYNAFGSEITVHKIGSPDNTAMDFHGLDVLLKRQYCDESSMISQNLFEPEVQIIVKEDWYPTTTNPHHDAIADYRERLGFPTFISPPAGIVADVLNPTQLVGNFPIDPKSIVRRTRGPRAVRYIKDENGVKFYMCEYCEYKCRSPGNLAKHVRRHTGEKPYLCPYCDYKAADRGSIKSHVRRHTGERPYKCTYCEYRSPYTSTLRAHMRKHTGEKPYFCTKCDYRCSQKGDLGIHMRKHSGHKPYPCTLCKQRFTVSSALVNHMRTHTKEKPFKCIICGDTFAQSGNLKSHLFSHSKDKQFNCEHCSYGTNRKKLLVNHVAKHGIGVANVTEDSSDGEDNQ